MGGWGSGRKREKDTILWQNRFDVRQQHRKTPLRPGEMLVLRGQKIRLAWTSCNYGGSRPWVLCPACGERFAVLYLGKAGYACRKCLNLSYPVQNMSEVQAAKKRVLKYRRMVKGKTENIFDIFYPTFEKPKGMWRRKFLRIHQQEALAGQYAMFQFTLMIAGMARSFERLPILKKNEWSPKREPLPDPSELTALFPGGWRGIQRDLKNEAF